MPAWTEGACLPIQRALQETYECDGARPAHTGLLDAMMSPLNRAGIEINPISDDGRYREVEIIGFPEVPDTDVQDGPVADFCATGNEPTQFSNKYSTDTYKYLQFDIGEVRFREICYSSPPDVLASLIMKRINAIKIAVEKDVVAKYALAAGNFYDGSATKTWEPIASTTPKQPDTIASMEALNEYDLVGCSISPLTVGYGDLTTYMKSQDIACCNQYGIDTSGSPMFAFFKSRYLDQTLAGTNNYFMFAPGTAQMAIWNANVGDFEYINERDEATTILDPTSNMRFDFDRTWNQCTKTWTITIGLNYVAVFFDTSELYPASHELNGTNGMLHFNAAP